MLGLLAPHSCKCSRACKAPDCQCVAYALKCSSACKNQLCDNMIDDDFEESYNDTTDEDESDYDDDENACNYKNEYHLCVDDVSLGLLHIRGSFSTKTLLN